MCDANPITTPILLAIVLFAWTSRHGTALGWYRGCGRDFPCGERGPVREI